MAKTKELTYSQALSELEKTVRAIESEEIEVEILAEKIRRAAYLIRFCKDKLRAAEEEVKKALSEMEDTTGNKEPAEEGERE